jgi:hypothetical protein
MMLLTRMLSAHTQQHMQAGCGLWVHQSCYGGEILNSVPEDDWYCQVPCATPLASLLLSRAHHFTTQSVTASAHVRQELFSSTFQRKVHFFVAMFPAIINQKDSEFGSKESNARTQ